MLHIESSNTGNCTHFGDSLCNSLEFLDFSTKRNQHTPVANLQELVDPEMVSCDRLLIQMDYEHAYNLQDNVLYYIAGYIVRKILPKLQCTNCRSELLLNPDNPNSVQM